MKNTTIPPTFILLFIIATVNIATSQNNNLPSNNIETSASTRTTLGATSTEVDAMYFYNSSIGWVFGINGIIAKTTNGGAQWMQQNSHTNNYLLKIFFINPNVGWACGYNGAFLQTTDGGDLWTPKSLGTSTNFISVFFLDQNHGWVVGGGGLILSTQNGGTTWTPQVSGTTNDLRNIIFINPDTGWITGNGGCILHTTNAGITWTPQNSTTTMILWQASFPDSLHGYAVGGDPNDYYSTIFLKTTNGGISWSSQTPSILNLFDLGFISADTGWIVGRGGYILKTTNGGNSWISQGTTSLWLSWASFLNKDTAYILNPGTAPSLLTTTDGGNSWNIKEIIISSPATKLIFGQEPTSTASGATISPAVTVYIEDANGNIVVSDSMTYVALTINVNTSGGTLIGGGAVKAVNGVATFSGLSINKSGTGYTLSANSTPVLTGVTSTTFNITIPFHHVINITDVPNDNGKQVFIKWTTNGSPIDSGVTNFGLYRYDRQEWTYIEDVPVLSDSVYQAIAPTLYDSTIAQGMSWSVFKILARTAEPSIYETIGPDSGYSVDNLPPRAPTNGVAMRLSNGNVVIRWNSAGNTYGDFKEYVLYRSSQPNFVPSPMTWITFVQDTVYNDLTTQGIRFYYKITSRDYSGNESQPLNISSVTDVELVNSQMPQSYNLSQNYPNPFNPSTTIQFSIVQSGYVTLKVFNLSGQEVALLISQEMTPGTYTASFSAKNLSSGMYFYQLQAGIFTSTKKMLVVK